MADTIFVPADVYVNNVYAGQAEETEITFSSMGEQLIAADFIGESTGKVTTEATIKSIVAADGSVIDLVALTISQAVVSIGYSTNAKSYLVIGKMIKTGISSNNKTGAVKGTHNFRGGQPQEISIL